MFQKEVFKVIIEDLNKKGLSKANILLKSLHNCKLLRLQVIQGYNAIIVEENLMKLRQKDIYLFALIE